MKSEMSKILRVVMTPFLNKIQISGKAFVSCKIWVLQARPGSHGAWRCGRSGGKSVGGCDCGFGREIKRRVKHTKRIKMRVKAWELNWAGGGLNSSQEISRGNGGRDCGFGRGKLKCE